MSDTPRTDAATIDAMQAYVNKVDSVVPAGFARTLERELNGIIETYANIINEPCRKDERHCTCVPALKGEIERLRDALFKIDDILGFDYPTMPEASRSECFAIARDLLDHALKTKP